MSTLKSIDILKKQLNRQPTFESISFLTVNDTSILGLLAMFYDCR